MKCLVCGKEFVGTECPICKFPVVEIPGDYEAGLRALKPTIDIHRKAFAEKISLEVVTYLYDVENSSVNTTGTKNLSLGRISELLNNTKWLDAEFDNLDLRKTIDIDVVVNIDGMKQTQKICITNFKTSEKITLGVSCDDEFKLCLKIKNKNGEETTSEKQSLFNS